MSATTATPVRTITPSDLRRLLDAGSPIRLVDVRSPSEFDRERIAHALNVPLERVPQSVDGLPKDRAVVLVCEAGGRARLAANALEGKCELMVLDGGMKAWRAGGNPVEGQVPGVWSLERQVRAVAGTFVLVGSLLGLLVNPTFLAIPIFFGVGLTFSGVTGFCGMGLLLAKMPWNRPRSAAGPCWTST